MLALLDPLLLLGMWFAVYWAFGWRVLCVALIWWGTNHLANYAWNGGAFLRQDWLVLAVVGICLVRKGKPGWGGFALTYAALLRVFPGFIVAALILKALLRMWKERTFVLSDDHKRFAVGCVAAVILLVGLSSAASGGIGAWGDFLENSRLNVRSTGTNTVGLMTVLSYEHDKRLKVTQDRSLEDANSNWLAAKREIFSKRRPLFWVLLAGFLIALAQAVRDEPDWAALALGIGLIPMASFPSCYYFSIFTGYALLWDRRRSVGVLLCALAIASHVAAFLLPRPIEYDQRFAWISLAVVITVGVTTIVTLLGKKEPADAGKRRPAHS